MFLNNMNETQMETFTMNKFPTDKKVAQLFLKALKGR